MPDERYNAIIGAEAQGFPDVLDAINQLATSLSSVRSSLADLKSAGDIAIPTPTQEDISTLQEYAAVVRQMQAAGALRQTQNIVQKLDEEAPGRSDQMKALEQRQLLQASRAQASSQAALARIYQKREAAEKRAAEEAEKIAAEYGKQIQSVANTTAAEKERLAGLRADAKYAFSERGMADMEKAAAQAGKEIQGVASAAKAEAERIRQARSSAQYAFGVGPNSPMSRQRYILSDADIAAAKAPYTREVDTSSVGRIINKLATLEAKRATVVGELLTAEEAARDPERATANSAKKIGSLEARRVSLEQSIAHELELVRTGTRTQASSSAEAAAAYRQQGLLSRGFGQFALGFRGAGDLPYLQQAGQAAKFSVLYGAAYKALFGVSEALHEALRQGIAFQQGMSDLSLATNRPKAELDDLGERLAKQAAAAGQNPSEGIEVGARAIGLYNAQHLPASIQSAIALGLNGVVQKIAIADKALGAEVDVNKTATTVAAVTKALGAGYQGAGYVADLDAYFSKRAGIQGLGSTLEGAETSAAVGTANGFSPEQIIAYIASLMNSTGQTSHTVGGYLAQIFSRGGEGSLRKINAQYGINSSQSFEKQFEALSKVYQNANTATQAQIASAFGRGKVQNAVVDLLKNLQELNKQASQAKHGGSEGALDRAAKTYIDNIGGQLAILSADFKEFAHLFGESGLLSLLGAGIKVLDELIRGLNTLLQLYNKLPNVLQDIIGLAGGLALLNKAGVLGRVGGLLGIGGKAAIGEAPTALLGRYFGEAGTGAVAAVRGVEGGAVAASGGLAEIATAGGALAALPIAAAAGGLLAVAKIATDAEHLSQATSAAITSLKDLPGQGSTSAAFASSAHNLRERASDLHVPWYVRMFGGGDSTDKLRDSLEKEAKAEAAIAKAMESRASGYVPKLFGAFTDKDITTGLTQIANHGGTAVQQLRQLDAAISGLGKTAGDNAAKIRPNQFGRTLASSLYNATGTVHSSRSNEHHTTTLAGLENPAAAVKDWTTHNLQDYSQQIEEALSPSLVSKRLAEAMQKVGVTSFKDVTPKVARSLANQIVRFTPDDFGGDAAAAASIQKVLRQRLTEILLKQTSTTLHDLGGATSLTSSQATALANHALNVGRSRTALRPDVDLNGRLRDAQRTVQRIKAIQNKNTGKDSAQLILDLHEAEVDLANAEVAKFEAAYRQATNGGKKVTQQARRMARALIRSLVHKGAGGADALAKVLGELGPWAKAYAQHYINEIRATQRAGAQASRAMAAAARAIEAAIKRAYALADAASTASEQVTQLVHGQKLDSSKNRAGVKTPSVNTQAAQEAISSLTQAANDSIPDIPTGGGGGGAGGGAGGGGGGVGSGETAAQRRAARLAAYAIKNGGEIKQAMAAVAGAKADMAAAKKGTVEYYNALQSYFSARQQLTQAFQDFRNTQYLWQNDDTDPIIKARAAVRQANQKLRADQRRGAGKDVILADKLAQREALEARDDTIFNQRLQDIQTQEQLGQITQAAYIRYLKHEHNRLEAVKHRTYQQQQELNQVDQLLQDAANQMNGQWNFGDIKLPTPYQVRRYIAEQSHALIGAAQATGGGHHSGGNQTTIYINGADLSKIRQILHQEIGRPARVLTTGRNR